MSQTLDEPSLTTPKIFKQGAKHEFPFTFRVVDYLPTSSCLHLLDDPVVRVAHLQLPPSLGDAMVSGFGGKLRDDFAPPDCRIEYNIQATLNKVNISTSKRETIILKRQKVRIKPAAGDLPLPGLPLDPFDNNQPPRCEVTVNHKGSGLPMGRLSVDLQQPDRFWLPLRDPHSEIIRSARLTLKYIPDNQGRPTSAPTLPIVKSLRGQITATTLYTTTIVQSSSSPPLPFPQKERLVRQTAQLLRQGYPPAYSISSKAAMGSQQSIQFSPACRLGDRAQTLRERPELLHSLARGPSDAWPG